MDIASKDGSLKLRLGEITMPMLEAESRRVQEMRGDLSLTPLQRDLMSAGPRFGFFLSKDF